MAFLSKSSRIMSEFLEIIFPFFYVIISTKKKLRVPAGLLHNSSTVPAAFRIPVGFLWSFSRIPVGFL